MDLNNFEKPVLVLKPGREIKGSNSNYCIDRFLGHGGTGVVYKVNDTKTEKVYAIKFFLPIYELNLQLFGESKTQQDMLAEIEDLHRRELECLSEINHPNIVRTSDFGRYSPGKRELSAQLKSIERVTFFVMDYVEGQNISAYLKTNPPRDIVVSVLLKIAKALKYLHEEKEYMHADLKPENILVKQINNEPIIIDFALYKNFNFNEVEKTGMTKLLCDWDLLPKDIHTDHPLKKIRETKGIREELKSLCFPTLDLFQIGKLLKKLRQQLKEIFSPSDLDYIDLVTEYLVSWTSVKKCTSRWLVEHFEKLQPSFTKYMGVEELTPAHAATRTYQLPDSLISVSDLVNDIYNTNSFKRLKSINQLAFIDALYPGSGYKRHLHSLRAYSLCIEFIKGLSQTPRFRLFFDEQLVRQALIVSLVHDINHFPLLHFFQEAKGKYLGDVGDILDLFCDGKATNDNPSVYELIEKTGMSKFDFKKIMFTPLHKLAQEGFSPGLQVIKSMIDSGADIDKMAYLSDDSKYTGVPFGSGIDLGRLIASATIVKTPESSESNPIWHIGYLENGISAVESLILARYWMFRNVYWHRTNRSMLTMVLHVLKKVFIESKSNVNDFVIDTMWKSEDEVLDYLNKKFVKRYAVDSIISGKFRSKSDIFVRLLSIQGASTRKQESDLYNKIMELSNQSLEEFRSALTKNIQTWLSDQNRSGEELNEHDVLIDIPGRRPDAQGTVFIKMHTGEVLPIESIPGPIQGLSSGFEELAKRLRIFVNPKAVNFLSEKNLVDLRPELMIVAEESLKKNPGDQIQ